MQEDNMVVSLRPGAPAPAETPQKAEPPAPMEPRFRRRAVVVLAAAVAGVVFAGGLWYGLAWRRSAPQPAVSTGTSAAASTTAAAAAGAASAASAADPAADAVAKVGKLIELPQGETPTVATVTDPDKLKTQAFFVTAKAGDIVLLYTVAHKAYLYDPAANILVDVAPITTTTAATSTAATSTP